VQGLLFSRSGTYTTFNLSPILLVPPCTRELCKHRIQRTESAKKRALTPPRDRGRSTQCLTKQSSDRTAYQPPKPYRSSIEVSNVITHHRSLWRKHVR